MTTTTPCPVPFSKDQYDRLIMDLLPNGIMWNKDPSSNCYKLTTALASPLYNLDVDAVELLHQVNPAVGTDFLSYWQAALGLPDKCVSTDSSIEVQQQQVIQRLTTVGGMYAGFYEQTAASFGYDIEVVEYGGALCGEAECGTTYCQTDGDDDIDFAVTFIENTSQDCSLLVCEFDKMQILAAHIKYYLFQPATGYQYEW